MNNNICQLLHHIKILKLQVSIWWHHSWIRYQIKLLKYRPRLWWNKCWIRADEFDSSLEMDCEAMCVMNERDVEKYLKELTHRRTIAHERDLK